MNREDRYIYLSDDTNGRTVHRVQTDYEVTKHVIPIKSIVNVYVSQERAL